MSKTSSMKMVDLERQYQALRPAIDAAMAEVLATTAYINGPAVGAFEKALAGFLGGAQVVACASGTDALQIAFMASGIGPGDEVVTTPFTFVATVEALVLLGAKPVYVDIDPRTYNLDARLLEQAIGPRCKAIVPVHLYGQCADLDPILALAARHGLVVIEDAAQAIGARYHGKQAATIGTLGCLSFFPAKNLGCFGDGGAVVTHDATLAARCRMIANHGSKQRYVHEIIGVNSRLDTLQAAVLGVKLPHLAGWNEKRRTIARIYDERLAGLPLTTPFVAPGCEHVYQQYSIRTGQRDALAKHLGEHGVPTAIHYPRPIHQQAAFKHLTPEAQFPIAEQTAREILSLPMFPELTDAEIDQVTGAVRGFFVAV